MTDRELFEQALEALQAVKSTPASKDEIQRAWIVSDLLKRRLAQPEHHELQAKGEHPAPCARHCEATAFQIVIKNLKAQLAQPEQKPVAWPCLIAEADFSEDTVLLKMQCTDYKVSAGKHWLYTAPPQRKPLTDEEIDALVIDKDGLPNSHLEFARAIEVAHGIKENRND